MIDDCQTSDSSRSAVFSFFMYLSYLYVIRLPTFGSELS